MNKIFLILFMFINLSAYDAFISPTKLKSSFNDKHLVIIDVDSSALYNKSHIDGAIHLNVNNFIDSNTPYMHMKSSIEIQNELNKIGIKNNSNIIIYSHNTEFGILNSSYLALVLISHGFENVSILNGGYMAWVFENPMLISKIKSIANEDGNLTISRNENIFVNSDYIKEKTKQIKILDSRSSQHYYGTKRSNNIERVGHIPTASSSYYKDKFLNDGVLREYEELNEMFAIGHEINKQDEIIIYGDNIFNASMNWYILYKHMGYKNTKIYEASLLEWGNTEGLPMIRFKWE